VPDCGDADDFESYEPGDICTQSLWEGWQGNPDLCGTVVDHLQETGEGANSGLYSLKIVGVVAPGDDTVLPVETNGGYWVLSIWAFVPNDAVGQAWIIMLNQYPDPPNWSLQVRLDADIDQVVAEFDGENVPLIRGRWAEFRAEIDLANDMVDYFYGGQQFVFGKSWIAGVGEPGLPQIRALDLYGGEPEEHGTSATYFEDVSIVGGDEGLCGVNAKLTAKCKKLGRKVNARLKKAEPYIPVIFRLDGGQDQNKTTSKNGKSKAKWKTGPGGHTVTVCQLQKMCQ